MIKYDSNLNQLWEIVVGDNGNGNTNAYLIDIEYDSLNDLLYVVGKARDAELNPLGSSVISTNNSNIGSYFVAYNPSGILQFSHGFETDISCLLYTSPSPRD